MNSSLFDIDRTTHLKIVMVALAAVATIIAIGFNAQLDRTSTLSRQPNGVRAPVYTPAPEVKPAAPLQQIQLALGNVSWH